MVSSKVRDLCDCFIKWLSLDRWATRTAAAEGISKVFVETAVLYQNAHQQAAMVPSSRRATRVVTCWFVFVADAIAGNLRAGARLRGRSDREGTRTRNLYFPRSSTLEDYVLACETSLRGSQIDQHEFAAFVVGYCRASNSKGKGCPLEEVPFSSLPLELQLSFVDCPGSTTYAQIDCLRHLVETSDSLVHNGAAGALCARTFPLMKSIGFLHSEVLAVSYTHLTLPTICSV